MMPLRARQTKKQLVRRYFFGVAQQCIPHPTARTAHSPGTPSDVPPLPPDRDPPDTIIVPPKNPPPEPEEDFPPPMPPPPPAERPPAPPQIF